jgi:NAD(P)-dependent dehydrogenase (short-subunit alcohol dehydrogenase family)
MSSYFWDTTLVAFLASDEASFITGQTIFICGGITGGIVHY